MNSSVSWKNRLYRGDCLQALQQLQTEGVQPDLIYLDPPFNSNRVYNLVFPAGGKDAQQEAFSDSWGGRHADYLRAEFTDMLGDMDVSPELKMLVEMWVNVLLRGGNEDRRLLNYLIYMTERLILMQKVLSPTGSIYLHCDPTASHYIKVMMDAVWGRSNFRNEIVWCYPPGGRGPKLGFHKKHDVILFYGNSAKEGFFNRPYTPLTDVAKAKFNKVEESTQRKYKEYPGGKSYLDDSQGRPVPTWWTDIDSLGQTQGGERMGYRTQKPVALLARIINASCPPGGLVLDPFCGCGTTIEAAHRLKRLWIGVDISGFAVQHIESRVEQRLHIKSKKDYDVLECDPQTRMEYERLKPYEKQKWLVERVGGIVGGRGADGGIDGKIRIHLGGDGNQWGNFIISVKTGKQAQPAHVDELIGAMQRTGAKMGGLILDQEPTTEMERRTGNKRISYQTGHYRAEFKCVQILTADDIFGGVFFDTPPTLSEEKFKKENKQRAL